jgi:acetylornithine aminotransferase
MASGRGCYLYDDQGKQYLDLESGVWCLALGHGHHRLNQIIKDQVDAIMHAGYCYSNDIVESAAEAVLSITGFKDGQCVFLCSGSESIELARQIAKHLTGKSRSMTLHDSYLGSYSSVKNRSRQWYVFNWEACATCDQKEDCSLDCQSLQDIPDDVSEFIFEPGSSSGYVRFPPKALIQNIVAIIRENGGKIICNEVTTGIGRTGLWFGHQHYDIVADMVAMGKGIGNGYPVSATAINGKTLKELAEHPFRYMQSHQNDPLGASIVKEVLAIIKDEDLISKAELKGTQFLALLQGLADGVTITDVRGRGLMFGIGICDTATGDEIYHKLLAKGYIVCNRDALFRVDPPLIIEDEDFRNFMADFQKIIDETRPH